MDIINVVEWSRAQFALTACYHWLFVPLTLGLGIIVAVMETVYYRTRKQEWLSLTKFWMTLFGVNFAIGVATGIILEFEFGTNFSNYSWFVGDIFGAPLAIEGIFAFFCESTFFAVMFFGWKKFSAGQHLAATWLTAFGASLSAWWILVANSWMQYPVGMEFSADQMRNVMVSFRDVALSPVAVNKFIHAVTSGWCLAGAFVVCVSGWFLMKKRNVDFAVRSVKVGGAVGLAGILLCMFSGDGSAVEVTKVQPMKLAAMEGLYEGKEGTSLVGFGILNTEKQWNDDKDPMLFEIAIPKGLSMLGRHDANAFIPGIKDIIEGKDIVDGKMVNTVPYAERIKRGKAAQKALEAYNEAKKAGDAAGMAKAEKELQVFWLRLLQRCERSNPRCSHGVLSFPYHGRRRRMAVGVPRRNGVPVVQETRMAELQMEEHKYIPAFGICHFASGISLLPVWLDSSRSGSSAMGNPGYHAGAGSRIKSVGRSGRHHIRHLRLVVHHPAVC